MAGKTTAKRPGAKWPAYTVEAWLIERLKPYERNARKHSERQIEQIRASLRQFGWTMPILARKDGTVIAGHGRLEAAKLEGYKEIPVIVATGWSVAQCRAYTLADNKLGDGSQWDKELLAGELAELDELGMSLQDFGFAGEDQPEPDASPQLEGLNYAIVVRCAGEAHQGELLAKLEREGLTCEALIS